MNMEVVITWKSYETEKIQKHKTEPISFTEKMQVVTATSTNVHLKGHHLARIKIEQIHIYKGEKSALWFWFKISGQNSKNLTGKTRIHV